ncbi:MAG: alanine/glycine:cation symporter family protein [Georgenia sp.]
MNNVSDFLARVGSVVWGPYLLIPLLLGTGLYLTIRLSGIQFRMLGPALRLALIERKDEGAEGTADISQYQALATALAATVGTGNIVGVATAIHLGGPGAMFWMWVTGLVGMASKYTEAFLAVRFRTIDRAGRRNGGPHYYLARGIPNKFGATLGILFAVFTVLASFGIGNMTQANSISVNVEGSFGIPTWLTGIVLTVLVAVVLLGGIKGIARVASGLVPVMIIFYVGAAILILILNVSDLPAAIGLIFTDAFTGTAAAGGFAGSAFIIALQYGVARGIFSNESGLGSAPIAAAAAQTNHPVRQGLVSMTQTFIDTIVVVSFTGLVIITTGAWTGDDAGVMTGQAFSTGLPGQWGEYIVTVGVVLFAYSTLLAWSYYGDRTADRLFGGRAVPIYRVIFVLAVYVGATSELEVIWNFSDVMNGLMALPNLIGLLVLSGLVVRETKHYLRHDPGLHATKEQVEGFMAGRPEVDDYLGTFHKGDDR